MFYKKPEQYKENKIISNPEIITSVRTSIYISFIFCVSVHTHEVA